MILYQTDQWHDHKCIAFSDQSRQLESQTLATTGRNQSHDIPTREDGIHDLFLGLQEGLVAEDFLVELFDNDIPLIRLVPPLIEYIFVVKVDWSAYILTIIVVLFSRGTDDSVTIIIIEFGGAFGMLVDDTLITWQIIWRLDTGVDWYDGFLIFSTKILGITQGSKIWGFCVNRLSL